jgi:imidazolonepropionase-like amidohydrolase
VSNLVSCTDVIVVDGDPIEDLGALSRVTLAIKNGEIAAIDEGMRPMEP